MKTNVNIFNALNESFENEMKAKRALKESREAKEEIKEEKVEESKELKEAEWNLTLDNSIRKAINNEDYDGIIAAFKHYNEEVQKANVDESIKEAFQDFINDHELEFADIESLEVDDPEEAVDYLLTDFYDLCDNTRVFIQIGESAELKEAADEGGTIVKAIQDAFDGSDFTVYGIQFVDDHIVKFQVSAFGPDGKEMIREVSLDIPKSEDYDEVKAVVEDWMQEHNSPDLFYEGLKEEVVEPEDKEELFNEKYNYKIILDNGEERTATCPCKNLADAKEWFKNKVYYNAKTQAKAKVTDVQELPEDEKYTEIKKESAKLKEDETIIIPNTEIEPDYIISDVTVLNQVGDGDVQAPDIEGLLTLVDESLKAEYGDNWGHINILSSKINENNSFALVDISTPEIIKQLEEKEIFDAAIGKNLILENKNNLVEFKVNSLNGITRFSKVSANPQAVIKEWIETEFLNEAKQAKVEMEELEKAKEQKEVIEEYIAARPEMKAEIENIKMFIELAKTLKASEDMKPSIQDRMYGFAVELPANIEVNDKGLSFNDVDKIVEIVFGKEWVKEYSEISGDKVKEVIKDSKKLTESYEQFNIGNIEVVFNPETYETLYSIPSADVKDKKINLTKVPSVDTPYDTNTIIKQYIETRFGVIPTEEDVKAEKEMPTKEFKEPEEEIEVKEEIPVEEPTEDELHEDELPEEPGEEVDVGIDIDNQPEETTEEEQAETGTAVFAKIRPKQTASLEDIRERLLDGDTPTSSYIVVDNIDLSDDEWNTLTSNLTLPQGWLEGIKPIDRKNYSFNVIKVTNAQANYALLIDPLGYNYPRYIAIVE